MLTLCSYHVQGNTIHKSQEMEATPVPADEWMDKQDVIYQHDRILLLKNEENANTCLNMDEFEDIVLMGENESQKNKKLHISLIWGVQSSQNQKGRK